MPVNAPKQALGHQERDPDKIAQRVVRGSEESPETEFGARGQGLKHVGVGPGASHSNVSPQNRSLSEWRAQRSTTENETLSAGQTTKEAT